MIVWINGAFGSGKTSTAHALKARIEGSVIFDPENTGFYLRDNMPPPMVTPDFQDMPLWRAVNFRVMEAMAENYEGTIIVPMTLVDIDYYKEIVWKLIENGKAVTPVTLLASKETLEKRLMQRGEEEGSWAHQQIDRCCRALAGEVFQRHIHTDDLSIDQVCDKIIEVLEEEQEDPKVDFL